MTLSPSQGDKNRRLQTRKILLLQQGSKLNKILGNPESTTKNGAKMGEKTIFRPNQMGPPILNRSLQKT